MTKVFRPAALPVIIAATLVAAVGKARRPILLGALLLALVTLLLPGGPVFPQFAEAQTTKPSRTLVGNTGQSPSATATITEQYALGFRLGTHGQGYEISSVSIDLAAVPSDLNVSLWIGSHPVHSSGVQRELFDFINPASFKVGLNRFTAPAGAFAYPNINYYIVLSGFDTSLSIKETTSDDEDAGGETGAILFNGSRVRGLDSTGRWDSFTSRSSVLRLAVEGARRDRGILASTFAQPWTGDQEIISVGDDCCFNIRVGSADRYLIRGLAVLADDSTPEGGFFGLPIEVKKDAGARPLFSLAYTSAQGDLVDGPKSRTSPPGINEWAAPQGATVAGGSSYKLNMNIVHDPGSDTYRGGVVLSRIFGWNKRSPEEGETAGDIPEIAHDAQYYDTPTPGVTFTTTADVEIDIPHMAVLGEPLYAMVSNLGQTDNGHHSLGSASTKVASQGFTTGSQPVDYPLEGIGVNIEGSGSSYPDGPTSVSVAVHADSNGKPGEKLFDLISPTEYGAGHSFFEAPPGTNLAPDTSYVLVWRHLGGTWHRLRRTSSDGEDSGAALGSSIASALYRGADLTSLSADSGGNALEIAVYTSTEIGNATGRPRVLPAAESPAFLFADTSGIADADGISYTGHPSSHVTFIWSYQWIRVDGVTGAETNIGVDSPLYQLVEADIGNLIKVRVSFVDRSDGYESLPSDPFGPIRADAGPLRPPLTLVSNTGQSARPRRRSPTSTPWASGWGLTARATKSPASPSTWPPRRRA